MSNSKLSWLGSTRGGLRPAKVLIRLLETGGAMPGSRGGPQFLTPKSKGKRLVVALAMVAALGYVPVARGQSAATVSATLATSAASERALLDQYCVTCHNQRLKTAGLMLDQLDLAAMHDHAEAWEKGVRKLRAGMMPPAGLPRPIAPVMESMISYLEKELDRDAVPNL